MKNYETVVGLEIHAHLKTDSKMFCSCGLGARGKEYKASEKDDPNIRICPICSGQPGTLPVPNKKAIEDTILLGLALGAKINPEFNFERKNYYYPDLPKAYQITSATNPPVIGGGLKIELATPESLSSSKFIKLDHVHLEEDAGKLTHDKSGEYSLVDLNRAGTPLFEIITKPVLSSGKEAVEFIRNLQLILRYLDISDADMEKGQMRCDANISVRKAGTKELGTKVEIKNMNSFRMIEKAIAYEAERQAEVLEEGGKLEQETRGWDDSKGRTFAQRSKEFANDYRYFPEPDIPPIKTGKGTAFDPEIINDRLPELPKEKKARFSKDYGLSTHEARTLSANYDLAKFFEATLENIPEIAGNSEIAKKIGKQAASLLVNEVLGKISELYSIYDSKLTPKNLSDLLSLVAKEEITGKIAKDLITKMLETGKSPVQIVKDEGIEKTDDSAVLAIIEKVMADNPVEVERYKAGDTKLHGFFIGQIMKESRGQADPAVINKILKEKF